MKGQSSRFHRCVRIPAEMCCWSVLDRLPARVNAYAIRAAAEPFLPMPLEAAEIRSVPLGSGRHLVCAIEQERLLALFAEHPEAESALPEAIPPCIMDLLDDSESSRLSMPDFRTGRHMSPRARGRIACGTVALFAGLLALLGGLAIGEYRAAAHAHALAGAIEDQIATSAVKTLGEPRTINEAAIDPLARLGAVHRQLEATRGMDGGPGEPRDLPSDRTRDLLALLVAWPPDVRAQVTELRLGRELLIVHARVPDVETGETIASAIEAGLEGWTMGSRSLVQQRDGYELRCSMRPGEMRLSQHEAAHASRSGEVPR